MFFCSIQWYSDRFFGEFLDRWNEILDKTDNRPLFQSLSLHIIYTKQNLQTYYRLLQLFYDQICHGHPILRMLTTFTILLDAITGKKFK